MRPGQLLVATCLGCTTACAPTPSSAPVAPVVAAPTPSADEANKKPAFVGAWVSPRCGIRAYPRQLRFDERGTFETRDLFDVCRGDGCRGSGVGVTRGSYRVTTRDKDPTCGVSDELCIWLDSDDASRADPRNKAIPQYPALVFFGKAPYESDGEGHVCSYQRSDPQE